MHEHAVDGIYAEFGRRVRAARTRLDLPQALVAQHLGLSRASISNVEAGRQRLLIHQVMLLAEILAVEPADLIPALPDHGAGPDAEEVMANHAEIFSAFKSAVPSAN